MRARSCPFFLLSVCLPICPLLSLDPKYLFPALPIRQPPAPASQDQLVQIHPTLGLLWLREASACLCTSLPHLYSTFVQINQIWSGQTGGWDCTRNLSSIIHWLAFGFACEGERGNGVSILYSFVLFLAVGGE